MSDAGSVDWTDRSVHRLTPAWPPVNLRRSRTPARSRISRVRSRC